MVEDLSARGWQQIAFDPDLLIWADAANDLTEQAMHRADLAHWWVCEGTWFVGVDALDNDAMGTLPDGTRLPPNLTRFLIKKFGNLPLHKAQASVIRPGYPRPRDNESAAAFRYRERRDAAHVDGLKAEGAARARMIKEPHAYVLGIPLNNAPKDAAPLVVWEQSHEIIRSALTKALEPVGEADWGNVDITQAYQDARREVFETCKRVTVHANPGEAYLMHRLAVHGMAPWRGEGSRDRRIAYFRPDRTSVKEWLSAP